MHIVVSWDIAASGDRWRALDEYLEGAFSGLSFYRPLSTFFVLQIRSVADQQRIVADLQKRASQVPERIEFVVSPPMPRGSRYAGMLVPSSWPKVNAITD